MNVDDIDDAPLFSLNDYIVRGKVVSVYDGDSVKIIFPLNGIVYKWNCRLSGIDTPEIRTRNTDEKQLAYHVRDCLREKILNKIVTVTCGNFDKYGRLLTTINCIEDNCDINKWLLEQNYAVEYNGKKKQDWSEILKCKK
jgi:endonuclease YncB( thermonuclease family)